MKGQENYVPGRKRPTGLLFPWCKSAVPGGAVGGGVEGWGWVGQTQPQLPVWGDGGNESY